MRRAEHRSAVPVRSEPLRPITDLSVTPLLGVLIVLVLSYFATTGPHAAINVHLPIDPMDATTSYSSGPWCDNQIVLTVQRDGTFDVNKQWIPRETLESRLREIFENRGAQCHDIYIFAAPDVRYGTVTEFVDAAKGAGIRHVVMLIQRKDDVFSAEVPR